MNVSGHDAAGTTAALQTDLRRFATATAPRMPLPGRGETRLRFAVLRDLGRQDLALARLAEAHADALAILADAGRQAQAGTTYAVWAARSRDEVVRADRQPSGRVQLRGSKPWASGTGIVDHALITAESVEGPRLFDVDLSQRGVRIRDHPWVAPAFAGTNTATIDIDVEVDATEQVGEVGSYLDRPGFWHGAAGVAACWAGGTAGMADRVDGWWRTTPHAAAHRAAVAAAVWACFALVDAVAEEIDAAADDVDLARLRARQVRHLVDHAAEDVLRRARRGCGPAPFAHDAAVARHAAELELYVRQCHAEADLEAADEDRPLTR